MQPMLVSLAQEAHPSVWHSIVTSLPADPASLFTLAVALGAIVLVIVAGRSSGGKGTGRGGLSS